MENLFEHKDRRVIPNWRSFCKTTALGELNSFQVNNQFPIVETNINDYVFDWKLNNDIVHAADLLSAAIINNKREEGEVKKAANFILENKHKATLSQVSLACQILNKPIEKNITERFDEITLDNFSTFNNPEPIRIKVREIKKLLLVYPYNPILYTELSRLYSILGQEYHSIKAMKTAIHLAPNNRFVLRSATRLFTHYNNDNNDYLNYIHNLLKKSPLILIDPWLISAEISISTMKNKTSKFIKNGISLIKSQNIHPFHFTELASSLGTVELLFGGARKSRDFFNQSLIQPNDNSLAQIEWASRLDKQLDIDPSNFDVKMNYEALALDNYHNEEYTLALDNAAKWFVDMPFSKRPIMFGSNLASTILKDHKKSISFLEAGLLSHPNDPQLINNIAYSLALENNPDEAFEQLKKIRNENEFDDVTQICITATRGLSFFRSGFEDIGRQLYLEAIERTKQINDQELNWLAILNYTREELLVGSEYITPLMDIVSKIPDKTKDIEINILKEDVVKMHEEYKTK